MGTGVSTSRSVGRLTTRTGPAAHQWKGLLFKSKYRTADPFSPCRDGRQRLANLFDLFSDLTAPTVTR